MNIVDIKNIRKIRQKKNNAIVKNSLLKNNIPLKKIFDSINKTALKELLNDLNCNLEQLHKKCLENHDFCVVVSSQISKLASRQGVSDERFILSEINNFTSKLSVFVNKPKKDLVVDKKQIRLRKHVKVSYFRSIDAVISGKLTGYVFCKVILGKGSTQENSWKEAKSLIQWAIKSEFKENLIFLIDTDNELEFTKLQLSVVDFNNIKVLSHVSFQQWIACKVIL